MKSASASAPPSVPPALRAGQIWVTPDRQVRIQKVGRVLVDFWIETERPEIGGLVPPSSRVETISAVQAYLQKEGAVLKS